MKKYLMCLFSLFIFKINATAQVNNPGFETPRAGVRSPTGQCWIPAAPGYHNGKSAAEHWTVWLGASQPDACIITELVKVGSNCVPLNPNYVMGNMMHVKTTYGSAGLVASTTSKPKVSFSCWVYVIKGKVCMGVGDGGGTGCTVTSTSTCKWEKLEGVSTMSPANQVIIYAQKNDAEFYVDNVIIK